MQISFPFRFDARGRTALTGDEEHVRDLIELLLFTAPGERLHRPEFGAGLRQLLFAPSGEALATATEMTVQGALQQWLGDRIDVESVAVTHRDATLRVDVDYTIRRTGARRSDAFERAL